MAVESGRRRSEDEPGEKWDRCVADTILKTAAGLSLGVVFSLTLFKRRSWPMVLGSGFGLGYAMSNCQHDFRRVESVYLIPVKAPVEPTTPPPLADSQAQTDAKSGTDSSSDS